MACVQCAVIIHLIDHVKLIELQTEQLKYVQDIYR